MEEKKLTDEEIVKALEFKAKFDAKVAYVDGCACKHIRVADILDLIRSLRQRVSILEADNGDYKMKIAENELVSIDWHNEQVMYLQDENNRLSQKAIELEVETNNQKAEIERLANVNMKTIGKNAELLLKVDELTERRDNQAYIAEELVQEKHRWTEQAVKDTAKEILQELFEKQTEVYNNYVFKNEDYDDLETNAIINFSDSLSYAFEKYFNEKYGVEVDE